MRAGGRGNGGPGMRPSGGAGGADRRGAGRPAARRRPVVLDRRAIEVEIADATAADTGEIVGADALNGDGIEQFDIGAKSGSGGRSCVRP